MTTAIPRRGLLLSLAVAAGVLGALFALDHREAREAGAQTVLGSLPSLRAHAGEDPRAGYARLRIPSIGVDAPIGAHAVTAAGAVMPNPFGPADVAWYDFEAHAFGGAVGLGQNAVMSGHVDYAANVAFAGVRYNGPGVFARLGELRTGDVIEVDRGGKTYRYAVSWSRLLPGEPTAAWGEVLTRNVPVESITLYTCDGTFNAGTISYSHRYAVRAELIEGAPTRFAAPASGKFTVGVSGTTHPAVLAAAQRWPVAALYARHPTSEEWLTYRPDAPPFANTLLGHLRTDSFVIAQFR